MTEPFVVMQRDKPPPNEYLDDDKLERQTKIQSIGDRPSFEFENTFTATPNFRIVPVSF